MTGVISMSNKTEDGLILRVKDVFQAIQGDGPLSGEPCAVLQLEGCDLKCWFCDADFEGGAAYELPRLVDLLERTAPPAGPGKKRLCVITGGEPMMQAIGPLVITLLGNRWAVQIETAGNLYSKIPESPFLQVVCSPKTQTIHPKVRARVTAWKYLIRCGDEYSKGDGLPISQTQGKRKAGDHAPIVEPAGPICKPTRRVPVFLQPVEEQEEKDTQANIEEAVRRTLEYGYRLSLRQHKLVSLSANYMGYK